MLRSDAQLPSNPAKQAIESRRLFKLRRDTFKVIGQVEPLNMKEAYALFIFGSREICMPVRKKVRTPEAERIFQLRKQLNLDQEGFAAKIGVDQGTISKWENGRVKPGPHTYRLLASLARGDLRSQFLKDAGLVFMGGAGFEPSSVSEGSPLSKAIESVPGEGLSRNEIAAVPPMDLDLLTFVIETIDSELKKRGLKLPSRKYAEAIVLSYEFCHRTGERNSNMVGRLLRIA